MVDCLHATRKTKQASHKAFILKHIDELTETKQDTNGATFEVVKHMATFGCPICLQDFTSKSTSIENFSINKSSIVKGHEKKCSGPPPPTTTTTNATNATTTPSPSPPPTTSTLNAIVGATHTLSTHVPNAPSTTTATTAAEAIHLATRHLRTLEAENAQLREQNARLTTKLESSKQHTSNTESLRATLTSATTSLETEKHKAAAEHARVCAALKSEAATAAANAKATLSADLETQRSLYASLQSATKTLQDELAANLAIVKAWLPSIYGAKKLLDAVTDLKEHNPHRPEFEALMNGWSNANARGIIMNLYDACSVNADTRFKTTPAQEATNVITTFTTPQSIAPTTTLETQGASQQAILKSTVKGIRSPERASGSVLTSNTLAVGQPVSERLVLPFDEHAFGTAFIQRAIASDALLRQVTPAKRAAMQLLDLYAQSQTHDEAQLELFKKAFSNMNSSASIGIVQRFYGDSVDSGLVQASKRLTEQEASIPDLSTNSQVRAAEEALCVMHLHNACRRIGIHPLTRAGFSALYLGEYAEVRTRFSGCVRVTCNDIRRFLRDEPSGRLFWTALCQRCGLPRDSYDSSKYQIEHVLNDSWGGADHYINFMVLFTQLNNSAEFRYGPGEVKMITLGKNKYQLVQRFARWDQKAGGNVPRDEFFKIESEHYALPPVSITGGHQLKIRDCLSGKKRTRC